MARAEGDGGTAADGAVLAAGAGFGAAAAAARLTAMAPPGYRPIYDTSML